MDPEVKALFVARAGLAMWDLFRYLDFDAIRHHPKIVVGYSAASSLVLGLTARTKMVTFHGPMALPHFGQADGIESYTRSNLFEVLAGCVKAYQPSDQYSTTFVDWKLSSAPLEYRPNPGWRTIRGGKASGELVGGHLPKLLEWLTNGKARELSGKLLFWDRFGSNAQNVRNEIRTLKTSGVAELAGMIIGKLWLPSLDAEETDRLVEFAAEEFRGFPFPILADVDCGHTYPMITLPLGISAEMDADRHRIRLLEPAVELGLFPAGKEEPGES